MRLLMKQSATDVCVCRCGASSESAAIYDVCMYCMCARVYVCVCVCACACAHSGSLKCMEHHLGKGAGHLSMHGTARLYMSKGVLLQYHTARLVGDL